ncbi:MAG: hypothetical protein KF791_04655 [Verrucomicrobiae bacterium]|nr:hypothetical protein [Verrucomicrobiae bacterium]
MDLIPRIPWHDTVREAGRQHPARGVLVAPGRPCAVFVTVASKDRVQWMANAEVHEALVGIWSRQALAWQVGDYLLMPDHLHLVCAPADLGCGIERWIQYWKSLFTRRHAIGSGRFQRDAFHHRLRNQQAYDETWHYVRENPIRRGLVQNADDWPFRGRIFPVRI